jgi:disulfide bond formation protein DsbB
MTRESDNATGGPAFALLFLAWLVALASTLGALFVGEILGQTPCLLCWYQRIAMFPLALILGIACLRGDTAIVRYALALAAAGVLLAGWHIAVYIGLLPTEIEPCGSGPSCRSADMTILGGLPLPYLSLGAFAAICTLLLLIQRRQAT